MKLSEVGEFGLITRLASGAIIDRGAVTQGIGDDAAVLNVPAGYRVLMSSDMLVDGVHFQRGIIPYESLGHKAAAVNLSDIAAMGGEPHSCTVSLGLPEDISVEEVEEIYHGFKTLLARHQTNLVGGDTVRAPVLTIDVSILGMARPDHICYRHGAKVGDVLMVTGQLGGAAAGLALLKRENQPMPDPQNAAWRAVLARQFMPQPRLNEAMVLSRLGVVTSMIDISDGLSSEVRHLAEASQVQARIFAEQIPVDGAAREVGALFQEPCFKWALSGGEDYELLFTVQAAHVETVQKLLAQSQCESATVIGEIIEADQTNRGRCYLRHTDGEEEELLPHGFNHFVK